MPLGLLFVTFPLHYDGSVDECILVAVWVGKNGSGDVALGTCAGIFLGVSQPSH